MVIVGGCGGYIPHICCVSYIWTMSLYSKRHQLPLVWQLGKSSLEVHETFFLDILLFKEHNDQSRKITFATFTLCHMKHVDGKFYTGISHFFCIVEMCSMPILWKCQMCYHHALIWYVMSLMTRGVFEWTLLCVCRQLPNIVIS